MNAHTTELFVMAASEFGGLVQVVAGTPFNLFFTTFFNTRGFDSKING